MINELNKFEWIEAFKTMPTGILSDAMAKLGLPSGVVRGLSPLSMAQSRMVGMAFTVKQLQRHQESEGYSLTRHAEVIDQLSSSGDVLVIDVGGRLDICTGGAILALRAQLRGLSGFLIDGCFRDVQELINNEFPVHCRGISPVKSSPDLETVGINIPVLIGGVQIKPGDLIVADETGIIVIASKSAEKVLKVAWEIKTKEEKVTKYLRAGMSHKEAIAQSEIDLKSVDQGEK